MGEESKLLIPDELIMNKIYLIRGQKVMLDSDLAELYAVETRRLNEQVKRNIERFPEDFMFQLDNVEFENLKSQFATSRWVETTKSLHLGSLKCFNSQRRQLLSRGGKLNYTMPVKDIKIMINEMQSHLKISKFIFIISLIYLLNTNVIKSQQIDTKPSSKRIISMVIVINGKADEYLFPTFIKYKNGLPIDTLIGNYLPGKIEFNNADFVNFTNIESDSIIVEFESYQQLKAEFNPYSYTYRFQYYQNDFDADSQVYEFLRMCVKSYRKEYFKKSKNHKGGYVVIYNIGQSSIPVLDYVRPCDD